MVLPSASREEVERERRRGSLYDVLEAAAAYYQKLLRMPEGKPAVDYLRLRGVGEAAIQRFRLGYAPEGRFAIKAALVREGFADEAMIEAGLLVRPEDGSRGAYDRFRGRLMFPIADRRGHIVGFGGRILGAGEPKYLNSPETPLFHKGRLLYNLADGSNAAREKGTVVVVEGYMDVIGLAEAGWQNVVAPLGTAITEDQLQALWRLAPEPILLFDPDAAGERAAVRAAERALPLLKPGLGLKIALLRIDTKDDPDRVAARYPAQIVHRTLQEAAPLSEFLFRLENKGRVYVSPEERAAVEERLRKHASLIADAGVRAHFLRGFRERTWRSLRRRNKGRAGSDEALSPTVERTTAGTGTLSSRAQSELILVAIMLNHPAFFHEVEEEIGSIRFADTELDRLRQALIVLLSGESAERDAGSLDTALRAQGLGTALDRIMRDPLTLGNLQDTAPELRSCPITILQRASLSELQNMGFSDPFHEQLRKDLVARLSNREFVASGDGKPPAQAPHLLEHGGTADRVGGEPLNDDREHGVRGKWIAAMSVLRHLALREEGSASRGEENLSPEG